jgi:hypothetical protein
MRNTFLILSLLVLGVAWAAHDPLVGPGVVGEKDEKGHVRGADTGAGPHRSFNLRPAPRVDPAAGKKKKPQAEEAPPEKKQQPSR